MENQDKHIEDKIQDVVSSLKFEFKSLTVALIVLSVIVYYFESKMPKTQGTSAVQIQSLLMIVMMVALPNIFIWFKNRMKYIQRFDDSIQKLNAYLKYSRIRQYALFVLGLLVLIVQSATRLEGGYLFIFVVLIMGVFVVPSRARLLMESQPVVDNKSENQSDSDDSE